MTQELLSKTNVGEIPRSGDFQPVKNILSAGETGTQKYETPNKYGDFANTVKGLFSDHSEKVFAIVALLGFTLVFYSGQIQDWCDFWRYTAFLLVVITFYCIIQGLNYISRKKKK